MIGTPIPNVPPSHIHFRISRSLKRRDMWRDQSPAYGP